MSRPKPARSRHCKWGVSPDPAWEPLGARGGAWEGRATTPIHESGDLAAIPMPTPFEAKGVVDATASRVASGPGPDGAPGGACTGAETCGAGGGDGDSGRDPGRAARGVGQRGERRGLPDLSLSDRGRGAPQCARCRDPALGRLRQDHERHHSRGQCQPGAGPGGRPAGEEPDAWPGGPVRHLAGPDRAHRGHPGRPVHPLRGRRHRRRDQHHHPQGQGGAVPGHRPAGGRQLRHAGVSGHRLRGLEDPELRAVRVALREQWSVPERRDRRQRDQRAHRGHAARELDARLHLPVQQE